LGVKNFVPSLGSLDTLITKEKEVDYTNSSYPDFNSKVTDVLEKLDTYYFEGVDTDALYEEAIRGLVDSVGDPYTSYFTKEEYASFIEKMEGSYEGIGVVVSYGETEDTIVVVAPFKDSPGEIAGVEPGDHILAVDGVDVVGMSLDKVVELIKGEKGTQVVLSVLREEETLDISITRDVIEVPTIESELLDNNIGYIGMSGFDLITEEQFKDALADLEEQGEEGLIIDLRNNPGGYLHIVYAIVDELIEKGQLVVYTEDKQGNREELITETSNKFDKPLVILINENSASASEILAGAIKDHERGVLVGMTTFGKGLVQRTFDLDDNSAIKITVSKYYTPDGHYIHGVGIEPDVIVEYDEESETDNQLDKAIEVITEMIEENK
jgi:carboxyl-terminal processing protease